MKNFEFVVFDWVQEETGSSMTDALFCIQQHWHIYTRHNKNLFEEILLAYREGRCSANPADFWYEGKSPNNRYRSFGEPLFLTVCFFVVVDALQGK